MKKIKIRNFIQIIEFKLYLKKIIFKIDVSLIFNWGCDNKMLKTFILFCLTASSNAVEVILKYLNEKLH